MKIRVTENQYKVLQQLNEGEDFLTSNMDKLKSISKEVDALYSKFMYYSLAEFRDGDQDILVIERNWEVLDDKVNTTNRRMNDYYNRFSQAEFEAKKLDEELIKLENRVGTINGKLKALDKVIMTMKKLVKNDAWHNKFSNITQTIVK